MYVANTTKYKCVRNGKFFTIGDDSAEFFRYKKGDIIFNAEQTRQIFANGKITNGVKRGVNYASGSAFAEGNAFSGGSSAGGKFYYSTSKTKKKNSKSSSKKKSSSDKDEEEPEVIDWIEMAIDRLEYAIEKLEITAESSFKTLSQRLSATSQEISKVNSEIELQQQAYNRYMQEANSVGLSSSLASKVRNGTVNINEYSKETAELIKDYQEWLDIAI